MARHDRTDWAAGPGFPAHLLDPAPSGPLRLDAMARLAAVDVNFDRIAEPNARLLSVGANNRARAVAADPIRLLPLAGFARGDSALPSHPRPRSDHTLIWLSTGVLELIFAQYRRELRPGDLVLVPTGMAFAVRSNSKVSGHLLLISAGVARHAQPQMPNRVLTCHPGRDAEGFLAIMRELASEASDHTPPEVLIAHLGLLSHRLQRLAQPAPRALTDGDRNLVARFLHLAGQSLSEPTSIADLARQIGSDLDGLDKACIRLRGRRAIVVLNELRLARAINLLRRTDHSPTQIAAQLGYSSHAHMARDLACATGQRPEAFRRH